MFTPKFHINTRTLKLLDAIATVKERIRGSLIKVPWVPTLVKEAMAKMAWASTAIEGCTLSLEAVKSLLEGRQPHGYPSQHVRMAQNYLKALTWIQKKEQKKFIKEKDLFYLHKLIAEGAVDEGPIGSYRKVNVRAGLHVGAPWEEVPSLMKDLLEWLNGAASELPPVLSSAILHLRFVEIHPFRDGNGRVARALATWELYRRGFDTLHVFALDEFLQENRPFYIKNLQRVQVEGHDLGGWMEFICEAVLETLERVDKRIRTFAPVVKKPISLSVRQERLLRMLTEKGVVSIKEIAETLRVTVPGAHYALKPLLEAGIVKRIGHHKQTRYTL